MLCRYESRVEFGLDSNGDTLYVVYVEQDKKNPSLWRYTCHWHNGDLGGWLHFVRTLKEELTKKLTRKK